MHWSYNYVSSYNFGSERVRNLQAQLFPICQLTSSKGWFNTFINYCAI